MKPKKITDYTFEISVDNLDYEAAEAHFEELDAIPSGCSTFWKNGFYGRSYDWIYSNVAEFVVHTPHTDNYYATIGIGGFTPELTQEFVESNDDSELYSMVPFKIVDGMNEYGVVVNTNVVPLQKGMTSGTKPHIATIHRLCSMMLPRFILDRFQSARSAVTYIQDYVSVYNHHTLRDTFDYDLHIMVADADECFVIEFIDNETVILEGANIMTNFFLTDVTFNEDGSVYTPETQDNEHNAVITNNITTHGSGLERYNIIREAYEGLSLTKEGFKGLLDNVRYTRLYDPKNAPRWYTELVGEYEVDICVNTPVGDIEPIYEKAVNAFNTRTREDPTTWHTVHSSIYDIKNRKLIARFQEQDAQYEFNLPVTSQNPYAIFEKITKIVEEVC